MATLQRSTKSFRRQGSSGTVWNDGLNQNEENSDHRELRHCQSNGGIGMMERSGSEEAFAIVYARSLSTPAMKPGVSLEIVGIGVGGGSGKPPTMLKSGSGKLA